MKGIKLKEVLNLYDILQARSNNIRIFLDINSKIKCEMCNLFNILLQEQAFTKIYDLQDNNYIKKENENINEIIYKIDKSISKLEDEEKKIIIYKFIKTHSYELDEKDIPFYENISYERLRKILCKIDNELNFANAEKDYLVNVIKKIKGLK